MFTIVVLRYPKRANNVIAACTTASALMRGGRPRRRGAASTAGSPLAAITSTYRLDGVRPSDRAEPGEARLGSALERAGFDFDQAEGTVPVAPLVVVERAPMEVPADVGALTDRV